MDAIREKLIDAIRVSKSQSSNDSRQLEARSFSRPLVSQEASPGLGALNPNDGGCSCQLISIEQAMNSLASSKELSELSLFVEEKP